MSLQPGFGQAAPATGQRGLDRCCGILGDASPASWLCQLGRAPSRRSSFDDREQYAHSRPYADAIMTVCILLEHHRSACEIRSGTRTVPACSTQTVFQQITWPGLQNVSCGVDLVATEARRRVSEALPLSLAKQDFPILCRRLRRLPLRQLAVAVPRAQARPKLQIRTFAADSSGHPPSPQHSPVACHPSKQAAETSVGTGC